jgi:hypothetical protein
LYPLNSPNMSLTTNDTTINISHYETTTYKTIIPAKMPCSWILKVKIHSKYLILFCHRVLALSLPTYMWARALA